MTPDLWGQLLKTFLEEASAGRAPGTVTKMTATLRRFAEFARTRVFGRDLVVEYLGTRRLTCKGQTVHLDRIYLNKYFEWLVELGHIPKNPMRKLPPELCVKTEKPLISELDYQRLQDTCALFPSEVPLRYLITLAWNTGHRLVDLCLLSPSAVNLQQRILKLHPVKTRNRVPPLEIPLTDELTACLRLQMAGRDHRDEFVHPDLARFYKRNNGAMLHQQFRRLVLETIKRFPDSAGLAKATLHCFRHTRASRMGNAGVQDIDIASVLGMSSMNTLKRYRRTSEATKLKGLSA